MIWCDQIGPQAGSRKAILDKNDTNQELSAQRPWGQLPTSFASEVLARCGQIFFDSWQLQQEKKHFSLTNRIIFHRRFSSSKLQLQAWDTGEEFSLEVRYQT